MSGRLILLIVMTLGLSCSVQSTEPATGNAQAPMVTAANSQPQREFYEQLRGLCGAAFSGYTEYPKGPEAAFYGELLVARIASCTDEEIRIPFHVGKDQSRTWILSWVDGRLLFKHDHRHADGTPDEVTNYGGFARQGGTRSQQFFPADSHTAELIPEAATNVWSFVLTDHGQAMVYYLERHGKARFKATLKRAD